MSKTQQEIIRQGYQALISSLGVVDAIRFMQHFPLGQGDYTCDRYHWLDRISREDILIATRQHREDDADQYDEIIQ